MRGSTSKALGDPVRPVMPKSSMRSRCSVRRSPASRTSPLATINPADVTLTSVAEEAHSLAWDLGDDPAAAEFILLTDRAAKLASGW